MGECCRSRCTKRSWSEYIKRRIPVSRWLRNYKFPWLVDDALAGITVGLTAVPQGIAYGVVSGMGPQYGLYASFMASFVYIFFGSCESITIGPTAIMAIMVQPLHSQYGPQMVVFLTFLKGCIITLLGLLNSGFLLDLISLPVITGFTAAAAVNIAASQLLPLLGLRGVRAETLIDFIVKISYHYSAIEYADIGLGIATIILLALLKNVPGKVGLMRKIARVAALSRNIVALLLGTTAAYVCYYFDKRPFQLTGRELIGQELPPLSLPTFSVISENGETYDFLSCLKAMNTMLFWISIVSALQHLAVAKTFARGKALDMTQEMVALGLCNIFGSFVSSMPVTGSFTRTAINHATGVKTPLGGFFTGSLVLLALAFLNFTIQFIPKATLAGIIISAMYYMLDFATYKLLWRAKKADFFVTLATFLLGLYKLYLGIFLGLALTLLNLLYYLARPVLATDLEEVDGRTVLRVVPEEMIAFPAAEHLRAKIMKLSRGNACDVIFDCKNLKRMDVTVAKNLKLLGSDLSHFEQSLVCANCCEAIWGTLKNVAPELLPALKDPDTKEPAVESFNFVTLSTTSE